MTVVSVMMVDTNLIALIRHSLICKLIVNENFLYNIIEL